MSQFDGLVDGYAARVHSESNAPGGLHLEPIDRLGFLLLNSFGAGLELGRGGSCRTAKCLRPATATAAATQLLHEITKHTHRYRTLPASWLSQMHSH